LYHWLVLQNPLFIYYQSTFLVAYQSPSAGQVPAVGSQVGRFVGTLKIGAIAALESTTDAPVMEASFTTIELGLSVSLFALTIALPSWMGTLHQLSHKKAFKMEEWKVTRSYLL
jgi:hypothetical protein